MGMGRGERNYVLGMQNICRLRSAKQEREAQFGTRSTIWNAVARGGKGKTEERGHAGTQAFQEPAPISAIWCRSKSAIRYWKLVVWISAELLQSPCEFFPNFRGIFKADDIFGPLCLCTVLTE